jgi:hypothetical protein
MKPWHYVVPIVDAETGEKAYVCVTLSAAERADASAQLSPVGGRDGLIARGHALRRASKIAPAGFFAVPEGVELASIH